MGMNNKQKSIIKKNMYTVTYADVIYWIYFRQSWKNIGKIFHNYFCYSKKGEFEDLLRKGQLRGENEKKNVSDDWKFFSFSIFLFFFFFIKKFHITSQALKYLYQFNVIINTPETFFFSFSPLNCPFLSISSNSPFLE
jgi:hypothetical protein